MICPRCGAQVPPENWYCGKCGAEIRVVPEFEPEIETEIDATMSQVAEDVSSPTRKLPQSAMSGLLQGSPRARTVFTAAVIAICLIIAAVSGTLLSRRMSDERARREAELAAEAGQDITSQVIEPVEVPPAPPTFIPESGVFEEPVTVSLMAPEGGSIYYTLGTEEPSDASIRYSAPIVLEENGIYDFSAVCISDRGTLSEIARARFEIDIHTPAEPVIMEPSGRYDRATMIAAVAEEGCFIYYTTDGTDPTTESTRYTAPIPMPLGSSVYRFIAADLDGNMSSVVEREYHLAYSRLVTTDQARASLMELLARMDVLIDGNKQRGMDGYYDYVYDGDIEIEGSGEYYRFVETQVLADGRTIPSGLLYAVNTHDGSIHHLGYDSSGHYTLILMSGG